MLTQYRVLLAHDAGAEARPEWAYCLYAALLRHAPPAFAGHVHAAAATPVSQYLCAERDGSLMWTVNLLGRASEEALGGYLDAVRTVTLNRERVSLEAVHKSRRTVADAEALFALADAAKGSHFLRFLTPTAFKSRGEYRNFPDNRLILQSLLKRWNGCIPERAVEDGAGLDALAEGILCRHFHIQDRAYLVKGHEIPGFVGTLLLENRLGGFERRLADALFVFAGFAGVGIKTALGMGGVETD